MVHAHLTVKPAPPSHLVDSVPSVLSELVLKLLEKSPEDRYQTAHGLSEDLRQIQRLLNKHSNLAGYVLGNQDRIPFLKLSQRLYQRDLELGQLDAIFQAVRRNCRTEMVL